MNWGLYIKIIIILCFLIQFFENTVFCHCVGPDYNSVNMAVTNANNGDTIFICNGDADWGSNGLYITKYITLVGGNGTITTTGTLITWNPDPTLNLDFRVRNIKANVGTFIHFNLSPVNGTTKMTKIAVYDNTVTSLSYMIRTDGGNFYGVIYNNKFTANNLFFFLGTGCENWYNNTYSFGTSESLYFEDNIIYFNYDSGQIMNSTRVVWRYNTITATSPVSYFQMWDMHGNQGIYHMCGSKGAEYYGNRIDPGGNKWVRLVDQRDGKVLAFYNLLATTNIYSDTLFRNECNDDQSPCGNSCIFDASGMSHHVNDSYYWNIRNINGIHISNYIVENGSSHHCEQGGYTIMANQDFWLYDPSFDGSSGVGCGTLSVRPTACTPGVGYWATNQSCSDLTGLVGANPTTPISGTLYKCTSPNTWTPYYTPFTYPHPLRGGSQYKPLAPTGLSIVPANP
jgi:hypothetical protein